MRQVECKLIKFRLIEKIYTEESQYETDFIREMERNNTTTDSCDHTTNSSEASTAAGTTTSSSMAATTTSSTTKIAKIKQLKPPALVTTKTSPLVVAALSRDDLDDLDEFRSDYQQHLDNTSKHQIIKQIHDSMDHLKNELLQKGMGKFADDVDGINKNLEASRKKQDEMERIKREQELIRIEKVSFF